MKAEQVGSEQLALVNTLAAGWTQSIFLFVYNAHAIHYSFIIVNCCHTGGTVWYIVLSFALSCGADFPI